MAQPASCSPGSLRRLDVLLIENDPAAARLTKEAFREAGLIDRVHSVVDGDEAFAFLRREKHYARHPHPDLIFLDLHLPRKSGLEVLSELKSNPDLQTTPVVVISGSDDPKEVREAYQLHAACYVHKSQDLDQFLNFVRCCYEFWGSSLLVPPPKPD